MFEQFYSKTTKLNLLAGKHLKQISDITEKKQMCTYNEIEFH